MRHEVSFEELVDYVEGRLAPAKARRVAEHVDQGCPHCRQDLLWLRRVLNLMATDDLVDAPNRVVRRAQGLYWTRRRRPFAGLAGLLNTLWRPQRLGYVVAVGLAMLLILGGTWWAWGSTSVVQAATLVQVQGSVEVRPADRAEWGPARAGMSLTVGSALRSQQGTAVLAYVDGSRSYLSENSEVEILGLSGQRWGRSTQVRLVQAAGHTQHELASARSSIQVESEGAVAQANAANYEVWVNGGEVEVHAQRGAVTLAADGKKTRLAEGERGRIAGGRVVIEKPTPTSDEPEPTTEAGDDPSPNSSVTPPGRAKPSPAASPTTKPGNGDAGEERTPTRRGLGRRRTPTSRGQPQPSATVTVTPKPTDHPKESRSTAAPEPTRTKKGHRKETSVPGDSRNPTPKSQDSKPTRKPKATDSPPPTEGPNEEQATSVAPTEPPAPTAVGDGDQSSPPTAAPNQPAPAGSAEATPVPPATSPPASY